jgi:hypothetical protein
VILTDVNVLLYAHRVDAPDHAAYFEWLQRSLAADEPFGIAEIVLSGFLRIATHPRVFNPPTPLPAALQFVADIRDGDNSILIAPGERHWSIFVDLLERAGARGNLVPDAYLAALAIESGCEWISTDRDFARFKGLRWRHPLQM